MSHSPRLSTGQRRSATCILAGCLALLLVSTTPSAAQGGDPPLVVFGDSLSDSGNAFAFVHANATPPDFGLNEFLVPSLPYAIGGHHFSNGDTWIEAAGSRFHIGRYAQPAFASQNPHAMNFAVATARARDDGTCGANPTPECHPSLALLIASLPSEDGGVASTQTLYVIQFGGNDLRDALAVAFGQPQDPDGAALILQQAAQAIAEGIGTLYAAGARHFLVWNVPTQALTPAARLVHPNRRHEASQASKAGAGVRDRPGQLHPVPPARAPIDPKRRGAAGIEGYPSAHRHSPASTHDALLSGDSSAPPARLVFERTVTNACVMPNTSPFTCRRPDDICVRTAFT